MEKAYVIIKHIPIGRAVSVEKEGQIFKNKSNAERYRDVHNEQFPHNLVTIKEKIIEDDIEDCELETFEYLVGTFEFMENEFSSQSFETKVGNSIDTTSKELDYIQYRKSHVYTYTFATLNFKQEGKMDIKNEDRKDGSKTLRAITIKQRIVANKTNEDIQKEMKQRAIELFNKTIQLEYLLLLPIGDMTVEKWLNDKDFNPQKEREKWLKRLESRINKKKQEMI